jgi:hypothetical protein
MRTFEKGVMDEGVILVKTVLLRLFDNTSHQTHSASKSAKWMTKRRSVICDPGIVHTHLPFSLCFISAPEMTEIIVIQWKIFIITLETSLEDTNTIQGST